MSKIKNAARQLTAGLLCTAMTLFSGPGLTVLAIDGDNNRDLISQWTFENDLEGWYYGDGWDSSYHGSPCTVTAENHMLRLDVDYSHDGNNSWAQVAVCSWNEPGQDFSGTDCMRLDVIYETDRLTDGELKIKIYSSDAGVDTDITLDTSAAEEINGGQSLVSAEIPFHKISASAVKDWAVCVIGCNTTYSGPIWLDNISILKSADSEQPPVQPGEELPVALTFDQDINGWSVIDGYNYQPGQCGIDWEDGMLRLNVDYSGNAGDDWSEAKIKYDNEAGLPLRGANTLTMDVIFDPAQLDGTLKIKFSSDSANISGVDAAVNTENASDFDGGLKKAAFQIDFYPIASDSVTDWTLGIVGSKTSYQGPVYVDNITFSAADVDDIYVDATAEPADDKEISASGGILVTYTKDGEEMETAIPSTIKMVDSHAGASARKLYAYLQAVGESGSAIFGHQDSTWQKAGSGESWSDIYDVTGSYAGIVGFDTLSLVGNEYNVNDQHNKMFPDQTLEDTPENRVKAAAILANWNIEQGAVVTLSSHTPNFSNIRRLETQDGDPSYAAYDFSVYTPNDLTGDVANEILPGGAYNTEYNAFLDLIADFAHQVNGAILFRPFHENTGSWFWWGKAFCDAETYKNIFRYTVEYLRDEKDVHNLIYVYGPGSEAENLAEYEERYPGDAYVDMVGFDMYHTSPKSKDDIWIGQFIKELELVCDFAAEHDKLAAVTETGAAEPDLGDTPDKALRRSGNEYKDWYQDILDIVSESSASYFLVWANFGESSGGFYTPYVKSVNHGVKHGHEMMDYFINFFNDPRSIFASNQQDILTRGGWDVTVEASEDVTGYIVSPVGGRRILEETDLTARITGSPEAVEFRLTGTAGSITLDAAQDTGTPYYYAKLTAADLASLGESAVGTISLLADGVLLSEQNEIFNIPEAEKDPYLIDDFDSYSGSNDLLVREWAANKDTGCSINLSLDSESSQDGYALKFDYSETKTGWAGATITKEVDWSDCNALQFWTIPDGKQQKTVIQIQANTVYEVYLNLYDEYNARAGQPTLVTIPFSEFCQRDTAGNPKGGLVEDRDSVSSFGLWVNAVENDSFVDGMINGTIWYDKITAVSSDCTEPVFETPGSTPDQTFIITAFAGTGGSISPSGSVDVKKGANQSFSIHAQDGYRISDVKVDGKSVGAVSTYTFADITENHTIDAVFTVYSSRPSGSSTRPKPSGSSTPTTPSAAPSAPSTPSNPTEPSTPPSTPEQPTQTVSYTDVPSGDWYSDAVQYVSSRGLMTGTAASTFSPDTTMNRAMLWTILARMSHADTSGGTVWYEKGMAWAVSSGISDGTGVLEKMTREQMVTMLWRYAGSPASDASLNQFPDSGMVSPWAVDAVRWAAASGLLSGSNGNLNPLGPVTRAETAAILMRFCQNTEK